MKTTRLRRWRGGSSLRRTNAYASVVATAASRIRIVLIAALIAA
jgi:hypothetical protein